MPDHHHDRSPVGRRDAIDGALRHRRGRRAGLDQNQLERATREAVLHAPHITIDQALGCTIDIVRLAPPVAGDEPITAMAAGGLRARESLGEQRRRHEVELHGNGWCLVTDWLHYDHK
jgi:hypothetical protein